LVAAMRIDAIAGLHACLLAHATRIHAIDDDALCL
jgi:hypothetical protein